MDLKEKRDLIVVLSRNELVSDLGPDELEQLLGIAQRYSVPAGERLFELGDPADALLFVEKGKIALTLPVVVRGEAREVTIDEKTSGSVIAWSALVPPFKATLGARATADSNLVRLDRGALEALLGKHQSLYLEVSRGLNRVIAGRLAVMEGLLVHRVQQWIDDKERT